MVTLFDVIIVIGMIMLLILTVVDDVIELTVLKTLVDDFVVFERSLRVCWVI